MMSSVLRDKIEGRLSYDMQSLITGKRRSNVVKDMQKEVYLCVRKNTAIPLYNRLDRVLIRGCFK